jgi:membrane protease YdiL (CAAX protease family)
MDAIISDEALPAAPARIAWPWRVLRFPLTRIALGTVVIAAASGGVSFGIQSVLKAAGLADNSVLGFLRTCVTLAIAYLVYAGFVRLVEWRRPAELGTRRAVRECFAGAAIGGLLMTGVIGILFVLGAYHTDGMNSPGVLVHWVAIGLGSGIAEELVFRCLWFRVLEEWLGTWLALAGSSLFFGFAHMFNPGATVWSCVAITLEAGVLLGAAYLLTRRLWFAAGMHAAWNFTQGGIFGATVSGNTEDGLLRALFTGPDWLTGGEFGPEASAVAMALCTAAGIFLIAYAARRGTWVPVFWRRWRGTAVLDGAVTPSVVTAGVFPIGDGLGYPTPAENESDRRADRPAEDRADIVDEL